MARYSARGRAFSVFPAEGRSRSLLLPAACRLRLRIKGARGAVITYNDCLIQAEACFRMASRASSEGDPELLMRMARRWLDAANQLSADPAPPPKSSISQETAVSRAKPR